MSRAIDLCAWASLPVAFGAAMAGDAAIALSACVVCVVGSIVASIRNP